MLPRQWWQVYWLGISENFVRLWNQNVPTTSRNPSANGVCEQMHQTVANVNVLRTLVHTEPPRTLNDAKGMVDGALATASHAVRVNVSIFSGYSPGALAFHRDVLLDRCVNRSGFS